MIKEPEYSSCVICSEKSWDKAPINRLSLNDERYEICLKCANIIRDSVNRHNNVERTMNDNIDLQKMYDEGKLKPGDKWLTSYFSRGVTPIYFLGIADKLFSNRTDWRGKYIFYTECGQFQIVRNDGNIIDSHDEPVKFYLRPAPRKTKGWHNIYIDNNCDRIAFSYIYESREEADSNAVKGRIACIFREFTEGEGLEPCTSQGE